MKACPFYIEVNVDLCHHKSLKNFIFKGKEHIKIQMCNIIFHGSYTIYAMDNFLDDKS